MGKPDSIRLDLHVAAIESEGLAISEPDNDTDGYTVPRHLWDAYVAAGRAVEATERAIVDHVAASYPDSPRVRQLVAELDRIAAGPVLTEEADPDSPVQWWAGQDTHRDA